MLKRNRLVQIKVSRGQPFHQPDPKSEVGHLVFNSRPGRNVPVFQPQVGLPIVAYAVAGAVPAVNSAIVQAQSPEVGRTSLVEHFQSILLNVTGEDERETSDIIFE